MGDGRDSQRLADSTESSSNMSYSDVAPKLDDDLYQRTQNPGRADYGQVAPAFDNGGGQGGAQNPNGGTVWRDGTTGAPANSGRPAWRAGYGEVAPAFQGGGSPAPQNGSWRDGTTGGTTDPARGRGGYNDVAPGAGGQRGANGEYVPPRTIAPAPQQPGGGGNGLAQNVEAKRDMVERSLEKHTSFKGNVYIGGFAGWFAGGPFAEAASRGAKWYLARSNDLLTKAKEAAPATTESATPKPTASPAQRFWGALDGKGTSAGHSAARFAEKPLTWGQKAAEWWEKHHGLEGDHHLLRGMKTNDAALGAKIDEITKGLQSQIDDINKKLAKPGETIALTAEEQAVMSRYNALKGLSAETAIGALSAEEAAILQQRGLLKGQISAMESQLKARKGWLGSVKDFGYGMAVVTGVQFAESVLDRQIFGKDHANKPSWYTDSILMPASLILPKTWPGRIAAMFGTHILGMGLDRVMPPSKVPEYSRIFRPNSAEAFMVAGAALIPMRKESVPRRLAYVGTAWLASKAMNLLFDGESAKSMRDEAVDRWNSDKSERSARSMESAIEKFKDLGRDKEPALRFYMGDWSAKQHPDRLNGYRGLAILKVAAGEIRLDRGTEVEQGKGKPTSNALARSLSFKNNTNEYDNILAGYDLDLGNRALKELVGARITIDRAKTLTQSMVEQGSTVRDTKVKASEIEDLEKIGKRVDADIARVYGRHNIPDIYKECQEYIYGLNQGQMLLIQRQVEKDINNPVQGVDNKFHAKVHRDAALIGLAWAGVKVGFRGIGSGNDGASAATLLADAKAKLQRAQQLDPSNPDNEQLAAIAAELEKIVPVKHQQQWQNPRYNPLNVNDMLPSKR